MRGINKYLMVGLALLFAVGSIVIGMNYSSRRITQADTKKVVKETKQTKAKKSPQKEADVLFFDQEHIFLAEDITDTYVDVVASKIDQKDQDEVALFEEGKLKWSIQKALNELFTEPVLVGDRVTEASYKDTTTEEKKTAVATMLTGSGLNDEFATTVSKILGQEGKVAEVDQEDKKVDATLVAPNLDDSPEIQNAKTQLAYVVQNGEVVSGFTMEGYDLAKSAIAAVPAGDVKQALVEQLRLVETAMTNMGISYEAYNEGF